MAEERDPLVSRRYRELGSEEPPPTLDEQILARSRRPRSFQWHGPVAAAAVIVLAVAVTVHVERAQPPAETTPPASAPPEAAKALKEEAPAESGAREEARSRRDAAREAAPQAPPAAVQESPAQRALEAQRAPAAGAAADSAARPMESKLAKSRVAELAEQAPERWLEGIVELRAQGRHAEADESFKRFRERYPDYAIPEETKAKIERR